MADLTLVIITISSWNRLAIGVRTEMGGCRASVADGGRATLRFRVMPTRH
ncbi:MAG TPA: hypothetical protein VN043_11715 [Rhodanobacter sp.]|nr:hypothetical protein [Rhodanobacter sp.]